MAQKKHEKQLKALRYWEREFISYFSKHLDLRRHMYIRDQISCLTQKLKDSGFYNHGFCAMCAAGFIKSEVSQMICPICRGAFQGVTIAVTELPQALEGFVDSLRPFQNIHYGRLKS